ncbi:uncharacterized protein PHACADRAFT_255433 [Phanerochaete carnosa HHB-10118-sp]|uniref:Uncharacterized protein n=1 Tax=Phanerochaete carnosa (strain HHB-10118-sp) TaxID=650164 RepID=K5VU80_PHACS|nr:uncharacterized protein PHACADRAFT_255433 [Phanerochaete carnosa HHB-10118-sp]EKM55078.1 hypothetical protein PHACADRAFT_255433 [Phanerochaete carnosa HHB-10118-sp]
MSKQAVFWFEPSEGEEPTISAHLVTDYGVRCVVSQPHLGLAVKWQFWLHVELFPGHRALSQDAMQELQHAFDLGQCDAITSQNSMFPYDPDTATRLSKCFKSITTDKANGAGTFIAARLLGTIYRERFMAFWGEPGARLTRSEGALQKDTEKRHSWFLILVSPIFFFMPFLYMQEFEGLYVDKTVHYYPWRMFIDGLKKDWENSITPATVLIATNISFLSINSIDGKGGPRKSTAQIMSYISTILATFIYIVCQILQRHHRHHIHGQATDALQYISRRSERLIGLEAVAVAFSIPTALFLWRSIRFMRSHGMSLTFCFVPACSPSLPP